MSWPRIGAVGALACEGQERVVSKTRVRTMAWSIPPGWVTFYDRRMGSAPRAFSAASLLLVLVGATSGCKATSATSGAPSTATSGGAAVVSSSDVVTSPAASSSALSLTQRVSTVQVCVGAGGAVRSAALVGVKVAQQSLTPAQAAPQLQPIAAQAGTLAKQNASLPIGRGMQQLSDAITALEKASPADASGVQSGAQALLSATKTVLADCAAVRH